MAMCSGPSLGGLALKASSVGEVSEGGHGCTMQVGQPRPAFTCCASRPTLSTCIQALLGI